MLPARAQQRTTTTDGQTVILHEDGTWERAEESAPGGGRPPSDSSVASFARPASAAEYVEGENIDYQLWYDADTWKRIPGIQQQNPDVEHGFAHAEGGAQAMIISERLYIPLEKMKRVALLNMMEGIPDAQIVEEEWREVRGRRILSLKLEGTARQVIPLTYRGYYFGTVQVLTYTGAASTGRSRRTWKISSTASWPKPRKWNSRPFLHRRRRPTHENPPTPSFFALSPRRASGAEREPECT